MHNMFHENVNHGKIRRRFPSLLGSGVNRSYMADVSNNVTRLSVTASSILGATLVTDDGRRHGSGINTTQVDEIKLGSYFILV